ncbi:hypothetical protein SAMN05443575_1462 [Jatrophihabitans endophyticus]|uniref:N-acetyltransferase domain-containing protein n=1 Tax=Jatrophihabitans endophyticus TaxID=1206085 RepID=A0A1M5HBK4_9ACTN|nr:GNAT family N-acetyltransferase [Jatrophihabitans endophyticus]SHG13316.1 hypothetical protein SAMN05443575_1462 [Jatrophihabitans endophyticus]
MSITLVHLRRGASDDKYSWTPFAPNDEFNGDWWDSPPYLFDDPHFVRADGDGVEVARIELDHDFRGSKHVGAPDLGDAALEIQFMEVAKSYRRKGIGAAVIAILAEQYPDRRLLALSEEADGFWASLGWDRFDFSDGPHHYRPLFIQPAESA